MGYTGQFFGMMGSQEQKMRVHRTSNPCLFPLYHTCSHMSFPLFDLNWFNVILLTGPLPQQWNVHVPRRSPSTCVGSCPQTIAHTNHVCIILTAGVHFNHNGYCKLGAQCMWEVFCRIHIYAATSNGLKYNKDSWASWFTRINSVSWWTDARGFLSVSGLARKTTLASRMTIKTSYWSCERNIVCPRPITFP